MQNRNTRDSEATGALLRVGEVASRLAVSARTVWRLISEGHLASVRIGKSVRVPDAAVAAFIEKGGAR
jgi:excisionase family DNA binding protein